MRDKRKDLLQLEGSSVVLDEIQPKYFPYVIEWRNDKELNRFLNQPVKLTMESQTKWYEEKYLPDDTQGFLIMVDTKGKLPFGTIGWTDYDSEKRICVMGRLLIGNTAYNLSLQFMEAMLLFQDFLFDVLKVERSYCHVDINNKNAYSFDKRMGYKENTGKIAFPEELKI